MLFISPCLMYMPASLHHKIWCCSHAWPTGKTTTPSAMEATSKCRGYKKGVLFPTSTSMHGCYASKNISISQPNGEAKAICMGCKEECHCLMPSRTTLHRCSVCLKVSNSTLGPHGLKKECAICRPVKKIGAKLLKLGDLGSSKKNGNLMSESLSPSMPYSSVLPSTRRYNKHAVLCGVSYRKRKFRYLFLFIYVSSTPLKFLFLLCGLVQLKKRSLLYSCLKRPIYYILSKIL